MPAKKTTTAKKSAPRRPAAAQEPQNGAEPQTGAPAPRLPEGIPEGATVKLRESSGFPKAGPVPEAADPANASVWPPQPIDLENMTDEERRIYDETVGRQEPVGDEDETGYDLSDVAGEHTHEFPEGDPRNNPDAKKCMTAFLVIIEPDGTALATPDCNMDIILDRAATMGDMYRGCAEIQKDIMVAETSAAVTTRQMQLAGAMAEQERVARMQRALEKKTGRGQSKGKGGVLLG